MQARFLVMVMDGRHLENPPPHPKPLPRVFKITDLQNYGQTLDQKDPAQKRQHQLLPRNHRQNRNERTQRQRANIPHKNLRRISIIPHETHARPPPKPNSKSPPR